MNRLRPLALAAATLLGLLLPVGDAAAQAPKVLRFVPQADLRILDPIWTTALITRNHAYMVFDTLFALDANQQPQPQMVESWSVSDDRLTWRFTLRDGLRFHDGQPVRPEDCIASLQRWSERDGLGQKMKEAVAAYEVIDARSFAIRLSKPFRLMLEGLAKLSSNVPVIMPQRLAETDPGKQVTDMIGSGPFRFVKAEWLPGNKVVYERNPDYKPRSEPPSWLSGGKVVKVDRVEWIYLPDSASAAAALGAGEVDWWELLPTDLMPVFDKRRDVVVDRKPDPLGTLAMMRFNQLHPPFDDVRIRRAVMMAVDQGEYMTAVAGSPDNWQVCHSFFTCGTPLGTDVGAEPLKGKRDLEAAKRLIKEAGYAGQRVVILDPSDYPQVHAESLVTTELLRKLGFTVDLQTMDWGTVLNRRTSQAPIDQGGWSIFHTSNLGPDMASPAVNLAMRGNGLKGWFGWPSVPKIEALREAWFEAQDPAEQKRLAEELQREAFDQVPYIPLGQFNRPTAYRRTLEGVLPGPVPLLWNIDKKS